MPRKKSISALEPLALPPVNPILKWESDPNNTFEKWAKKAEKALTEAEKIECMARAYVSPDDEAFYRYCVDIGGLYRDYPPFHGRMLRFVTSGRCSDYPKGARIRLLMAFRGSMKSTVGSVLYPTWLVAREYVLALECIKLRERIKSEEVSRETAEAEIKALVKSGRHLEGVNIRIGLQSEELGLPRDHLRACTQVMSSDAFTKYFGVHYQTDRAKGGRWGVDGVTSTFRTEMMLREPTIWTISLEAPRIGRHFDVIIPDDLQSLRTVGNRDVMNQVWKLFKANFSLLNPPGVGFYSIMQMNATYWHYDDIYNRIERENATKALQDRVAILKMPVCNDDLEPTCRTFYPDKESIIRKRKEVGTDEFTTQMLLKPTGDGTQPIPPRLIVHYSPSELNFIRQRLHYFTGVDFCWLEAAKRNDSGADHSVVFTIAVDVTGSIYLVDAFREQCTRLKTLQEVFRQARVHKSLAVGMDSQDRAHVTDIIDRLEVELDQKLPYEWVSRSPDEMVGKSRRLIGVLQPPFEQGKIKLFRGLDWFEQELRDLPRGMTDDGLDALAAAIKVIILPTQTEQQSVQDPDTERWKRHTESLFKGVPTYLDGTPIRPNDRRGIRHSGKLQARRPRSRTK